jgi:hypothetical protein
MIIKDETQKKARGVLSVGIADYQAVVGIIGGLLASGRYFNTVSEDPNYPELLLYTRVSRGNTTYHNAAVSDAIQIWAELRRELPSRLAMEMTEEDDDKPHDPDP